MNNLVIDKIDEIIDLIKSSKEYQDYQFLFSKLSKNEKANHLIEEVKSIQKQIVKKEVFKESVDDLEKQLNSLLLELDQIPLYVEFVQKQEELDCIYQILKDRLEQYFNKILN